MRRSAVRSCQWSEYAQKKRVHLFYLLKWNMRHWGNTVRDEESPFAFDTQNVRHRSTLAASAVPESSRPVERQFQG